MMKKLLLVISITAALCTAEFVPLENYIGKHKYKCGFGSAITGARVGDKLYTFGGCYPIPYIVDPEEEDFGMRPYNPDAHTNVSNSIEVYDIPSNKWTIEKDVTTPYPWRKAYTQTYNQNIYFHNIRTKNHQRTGITMWKYDTIDKKWTRLDDLPFIWIGSLASCESNGKIYFTGTDDGQIRNIIQVYNAKTDKWEKPILPNKKLNRVRQMLCGDQHIYFLATEEKEAVEQNQYMYYTGMHGVFKDSFDLISTEYETGNTFSHGMNITAKFDKVAVKDDSFYVLDLEGKNSSIIKVDTIGKKQTVLGTFPHTLNNPFVIPYENDHVLLFGGGEDSGMRQHYCNAEAIGDEGEYHCNTLKSYNHKLVPEVDSNAKLVLQD